MTGQPETLRPRRLPPAFDADFGAKVGHSNSSSDGRIPREPPCHNIDRCSRATARKTLKKLNKRKGPDIHPGLDILIISSHGNFTAVQRERALFVFFRPLFGRSETFQALAEALLRSCARLRLRYRRRRPEAPAEPIKEPYRFPVRPLPQISAANGPVLPANLREKSSGRQFRGVKQLGFLSLSRSMVSGIPRKSSAHDARPTTRGRTEIDLINAIFHSDTRHRLSLQLGRKMYSLCALGIATRGLFARSEFRCPRVRIAGFKARSLLIKQKERI